MSQLIETIEEKVKQYNQLREDMRQLEWSLREDLNELDKSELDGQTWYEYLKEIDETIHVNDNITIKRESYRITGTYQLSDNITLTLDTNIYTDKNYHNSTIHYKETDRYVQHSIPKKYITQAEELKAEMGKYKRDRPSNKYTQETGISSN